MPAKRKYNVKASNDFLVLAGIFFFLGIWAVKDAWYPSAKVLKKHPLEVAAIVETDGSVEKVHVDTGDTISEEQVLISLRSDRLALQFEEAKDAYTAAKKKFAMLDMAAKDAGKNVDSGKDSEDLNASAAEAEAQMEKALDKVTKLRVTMDATEVRAPSKGIVKGIYVGTHTMVKKGDTAIIIDPKDHFYLFNKSLAIFSGFIVVVFLAVHIVSR
ncbi:MAG: efflux RND transporter periplasmic adaptor subunit [Pontiella sp.]|nr:efflux RND transporter periplasmic adaptor subunit [Pontiella sp.]MBT8045608.1 efflux RND transporter periplasmic adaptor subunit [Pontiella sp.]NNJ70213.1 hypothetical protein [Kiritimatiellales bacterium]